MITFKSGDLLVDDAQALVNTVNCVGVMGKGIALQFKFKFPKNYEAYRKVCQQGRLKPGLMFVTTETSANGATKTIINFPTKTDWRLPSEYQYIKSGLAALKATINQKGIKSIAIPALGCNNGQLDWNKVREMMIRELETTDCDIRIYNPQNIQS